MWFDPRCSQMQQISKSQIGDFTVALVLSGGNALGAYQAGAYQALHERAITPDWVTGASIGAINGALICGNSPEDRLPRLNAFWRTAGNSPSVSLSSPQSLEVPRRTRAAAATMVAGQPGLFVPRSIYGPWWNPLGSPEPSSLYDSLPMEGTLDGLIDFDVLNQANPRFSATAVDIEEGTDIYFDTAKQRLTPRHLRAATALLPAYSPVDIEGRLVGDASISVNLPLDLVLSETTNQPLLCIAIDLLSLSGPRPRSLGDATCRAQDLMFAAQSRRAIAAWQAIFREQAASSGEGRSATVLHIAYSDHAREVSGKAFDFSRESASARWHAGYSDLSRALDELLSNRALIGQAGLNVFAPAQGTEGRLERVEWQVAPTWAVATSRGGAS